MYTVRGLFGAATDPAAPLGGVEPPLPAAVVAVVLPLGAVPLSAAPPGVVMPLPAAALPDAPVEALAPAALLVGVMPLPAAPLGVALPLPLAPLVAAALPPPAAPARAVAPALLPTAAESLPAEGPFELGGSDTPPDADMVSSGASAPPSVPQPPADPNSHSHARALRRSRRDRAMEMASRARMRAVAFLNRAQYHLAALPHPPGRCPSITARAIRSMKCEGSADRARSRHVERHKAQLNLGVAAAKRGRYIG